VAPAGFQPPSLLPFEELAQPVRFPVLPEPVPQPEAAVEPAPDPEAEEEPRPEPAPEDIRVPALTAAVLAEAQRQGREEGRQQGLAELRESMLRARAAVEAVAALAEHLRAQTALDAVELGTAIARQVLDREISMHPDEVVGIARRGVNRLGGSQIRIRAHPDDAELLEPQTSAIRDEVGALQVEILPDPDLGRGSVVIESELGVADARIDAQLNELVTSMRDAPDPESGGGAEQ